MLGSFWVIEQNIPQKVPLIWRVVKPESKIVPLSEVKVWKGHKLENNYVGHNFFIVYVTYYIAATNKLLKIVPCNFIFQKIRW